MVMFGGKALWTALFLQIWLAEALAESGVATTGTTESFLKVCHITMILHAHQVLALAMLRQKAFEQTSDGKDEESFTNLKLSPVLGPGSESGGTTVGESAMNSGNKAVIAGISVAGSCC